MALKDANLVVKASGAMTSTTTSAEIDLGTRTLQPLRFRINVTSITGSTGTLSAKIQQSDTSGGTLTDLGTFKTFTTAVGDDVLTLRPKRYIKVVSTLGGTTPNFTFSVDVVPAGRYNKF